MGLEKLETFNVPRDLLENIQDVAGRSAQITMASMVQYEVKTDRLENRVLVLTEYRVLLMTCKLPSKIELSIPFINIHCIESKASNKLVISLEGKRLNFLIPDETKIDKLILHIVESLSLAFPKVQTHQLIGLIEVAPPTRQFFQDLKDVRTKQEKRDPGPCGGFSSAYKFMCDYHSMPHMADVIWDIDTIYMSQDSRELRLSDFDHLDMRYLLPIVTALEFNHWFTSLVASNLRLHSEVINSIHTVMRKNSTIEQLHLANLGLKSEFLQRLAVNVASNPATSLVHIDLSSNPLDDRGISNLTTCLTRLPKGLIHLDLSQTGMTFKGVNRLAESLCGNPQIVNTLSVLNLSRNSIRGEDITNLFNFLAQPNALTTLNLSSTDCALDAIFGALLRGCCQKLVHLDLSHNPFLSKKSTTVQASCKQFFGSVLSLKHVNLSNCRLPADAIKFLLLGLGSNPIATDIEVNLSGNNLGQEMQTLEMCVPDISNISTLDLSDNGFDVAMLGLIPKLAKNRSIKKLLLGKNFSNVKARNMAQILEFLTEMIHEEDSVLESLSLAGSKLRGQTNIFINALGGNSSLKEVDISGNAMGDAGARMLAKALQINNTLHTLQWDHNGTSPQGFTDVAEALEKNFSLKKMPLPLHDITTAVRSNPEKTEAAIQKIEQILQRNHSPRKFASDQGYRLQQGFLINTLQQMLDRSIVTLQATAKKLEDKNDGSEEVLEDLSQANFLIKDAGSSRQLLAKFQDIALKSETEESDIFKELKKISENLHDSLTKQVTDNLTGMLECANENCPTLMEDEDLPKNVESSSHQKAVVPKHFTHGLVVDQLGADLFNKLGELNLAVATHMSDQLIEGVLNALNTNHDKLLSHLRVLRQSEKEGSENAERKSGLLRDKSSTDDKLAPLQDVSATKRKSVYSRKVRPQSSVGETPGMDSATPRTARIMKVDEDDEKTDEEDDDEEEEKEEEEEEQEEIEDEEEEEDPKSVGTISLTGSTDLTDSSTNSPFNSRESTPSRESPVQKPKKTPKIENKVRAGDLSLAVENTAPKLQHLGAARPKPPRTRAVTRVGVRSEMVVSDGSGMGNPHEDLGGFFDTQPISKELTSPTGSNSIAAPPATEKETNEKKKKGWSPKGFFSSAKRSQSTRSPDTSSSKLGSPVKRLPEVKESSEVKDTVSEVKRSQSSEDELEKINKSEDEKEDEPEPEPEPKKRGPMVPRMGPGGNALMAEMLAKRTSMNPLASKNKPPPDDSAKETQPASAPSVAKMPPGGRPLFPPGGAPGLKHVPTVKRSSSPGSRSSATEEAKPKPAAPTRPKPPLVPPKPAKSRNSVSPGPGNRSSECSSTISTTASTTTTPSSTAANTDTKATTTPSTGKPGESLSRSHRSTLDAPARVNKSSASSTEGRHKGSVDAADGENSSNDKGGRKSPGAEPQSNGSAKDSSKEEFLMYL